MASVRSNVLVKLGLIMFPVSVETAVEAVKEASFNNACNSGHDPVRVKSPMVCPSCNNDDKASFIKVKDLGGGQLVVVPEEEIKAAGVSDEVKNSMPITTHPASEVEASTLSSGKVYYLAPTPASGESYSLLINLIENHAGVAFCTMWAPRSNASMYRFGIHDGCLTLTELAWPASVKAAPRNTAPDPAPELLELATQFTAQLLTPFDPSTYRDVRTETLAAFIAKQDAIAAGTDVQVGGEAELPAQPVNPLLLALQAAVAEKAEDKPAAKKAAKRAPKKPAKKAS